MAEARPVLDRAVALGATAGDFTHHVQMLRDAGGDAVDSAAFETLWSALRRALRSELIRRGLWNRPPAFLGVIGHARWSMPDRQDDALDELAADCYTFVFLERIQSLTAQLRHKPAIEGLVFRSIRNFLYERQKRDDPIGFRVFDVLRDAVDRAMGRGRVEIEPAGAAIGNRAWLRFSDVPDHAAPPDADALEVQVASWADALLPGLIVARGRRRLETVDDLTQRIEALGDTGVRRVRFRRLAGHLRQAVRGRWAALLGTVESHDVERGTLGRLVSHVQPPRDVEKRAAFDQLVADVERGIVRLEIDTTEQDYLLRLWSFARAIASETRSWPQARRYSRAAVAETLGIPRNRMPSLLDTLERLIDCQGRSA